MKTKAKTYLLLIAVLAIWGVIGYKIINGLSPDEPQITDQNFEVAFNPKRQVEIDTFSIKNVDRDPFLGTLSSNKKRSYSSTNLPNPKLIDDSPNISYSGLIKKQNTKDQVFVVNINNSQYLLKKGQTADGVKLVRGNSKEVVVRYNKKSQTIKRQ